MVGIQGTVLSKKSQKITASFVEMDQLRLHLGMETVEDLFIALARRGKVARTDAKNNYRDYREDAMSGGEPEYELPKYMAAHLLAYRRVAPRYHRQGEPAKMVEEAVGA